MRDEVRRRSVIQAGSVNTHHGYLAIICQKLSGIARDAAEFLANDRKVSLVGIDTASLDHGPSTDFITHQVLNGANVAGLENISNLDQLPDYGFLVLALPM